MRSKTGPATMMPRFTKEKPHGIGHGRLQSILWAAKGIKFLFRTEINARLHAMATAAVLAVSIFLPLTSLEWALVAIATSMVWSAEAMNTAIEHLADMVSTKPDPRIAVIKDLAAGAVLIAAIGAAIIGVLVFAPYLMQLLSG
ncbi:MAG: diacylglycerol kinase family protein [Deltaproteobacteria bacterium]|nr:diacylglycerol kinase family protein [Candidatus Anaeroferrophillus wilburensis]MBN2888193.1 diacylglycerol kinase family protein [Deltaproteobacteria bacterium]